MKNVKCVYGQEGGIEGDFRLRKLRHLAGEERTTTMHKENGLRLSSTSRSATSPPGSRPRGSG